MAEPPVSDGAVQLTRADESDGVADTERGALGGPVGVTLLVVAAGDRPAEFRARTENAYDVPLVKPVTVQDRPELLVLHVLPPGLDVTSYFVMEEPPVDDGADQLTEAVVLPADAEAERGALGTVTGVQPPVGFLRALPEY